MKIFIICCLLFIHVNMCIFIRGFRVSIRVSDICGFDFGDGFPPKSISSSDFNFECTDTPPDTNPAVVVLADQPPSSCRPRPASREHRPGRQCQHVLPATASHGNIPKPPSIILPPPPPTRFAKQHISPPPRHPPPGPPLSSIPSFQSPPSSPRAPTPRFFPRRCRRGERRAPLPDLGFPRRASFEER